MRNVLTAALILMLMAVPALAENEDDAASGLPSWTERVHLSGTLEVDYAWSERSDLANRVSDSMSDIFVSTVELGVEVEATDWLTATLVLLAEDLGTPDETDLMVDEATLNFQGEDFPLYLVAGKRAQPFGVFESHLVTDPMTQDAYETSRAAVTVGYAGPLGMDLSATVYKGTEMMDHLFESGLFGVGDEAAPVVARQDVEPDNDVDSFVGALSLAPFGDTMRLFGSWISEPGAAHPGLIANTTEFTCNRTWNAGASIHLGGLVLDGEYMKAQRRERYEINGSLAWREYRESVYSVSAAYEFVLREREKLGGALFAGRKAHVVAEPLEVAIRYESFDDDGLARDSETWSVKDRVSAGIRYSFYSHEDSGLAAYVATEFRRTDYRIPPAEMLTRAESNDEAFLKVGMAF